ncbi:MAG: hypothetical protein H0X03_06525, partial [Nitrosopumilus sp.]|nr:hypothetical protein [Nitrosopumilus sp.]
MNIQRNFAKKALVYSLFIAIVAGITFAIGVTLTENNKVLAQQQQNQISVSHNAKGHQTHQIVIFQNSSDGVRYSGMVTFNLSKPADVISIEDITRKQPTNKTKIWEIGDKKFVPKTLLKNVTQGSVNFNGSGILAHNTQ